MNTHRPNPSASLVRVPGITSAVLVGALLGLAGLAQAQAAVEYGAVGSATGTATAKAAPKGAAGASVAATGGAAAKPARASARKPPAPDSAATVEGPPPTRAPVCVDEMPPPVAVNLVAGKSTLLKLPQAITLRTIGNEDVAQARLLSPQALYLLGVEVGATNMILQDGAGRCTIVDIAVGMDTGALQAKLAQLLPGEKAIQVTSAADSLVLSGMVSDAGKVDQAILLATAYVRGALDKGRVVAGGQGGGSAAAGRQNLRVVNLLSVAAPQQVLLEVKVAEVSKALIDKLGASLNLQRVNGSWTYSILTNFLTGGAGLIDAFRSLTGEFVTIDGEKKDGLVKILAEPNLMAISGQEGSFLAGGKVFLPVLNNSNLGIATYTLQEEDFGVGLKFTPTVLEGGLINLRVAPEVSELSREGIAIQSANTLGKMILPLIFTRRAATTVQLYDGQSFAIGGLIRSGATTDIKAFPILGEIPILGALFRSTSFQSDKSELLFVVTPRLVRPMSGPTRLPTDGYIEPSRLELFLGGQMEGQPPEVAKPAPTSAPMPAGAAPQGPSGFEIK